MLHACSWLGLVVVLAGCASKSVNRAPVEDRGTPRRCAGTDAPFRRSTQAACPRSRRLALRTPGKPGYYTVKPGDTLIRIGLDTGQNWKDLARWNGLENPNLIEVGQTLRVIPPMEQTGAAAGGGGQPVTEQHRARHAGRHPHLPASATTVLLPASAPVASAPAAVAASPDEDITWLWPARGSVINGFDEVKNKGLDIAGALGEPVLAAADGRVVYVGAGLRGYGNLIIVKHNATYLTAYAHNQTLLVKEDQTVRRGQKIAEMGSSDADRVKLHFEVRRQGKPVDPSRYLPAR